MTFLKIIAVVIALFIAYLWSGGVWDYRMEKNTMRINKITGSVHALDFDEEKRAYFWRDAMEPLPHIEAVEESAPLAEELPEEAN